MAVGFPTPRRSDSFELLDDLKTVNAGDLSANLRDIRVLNRRLGATTLACRHVRQLLRDVPHASILDVATGSADIPLALLASAAKSGQSVRIVACDVSTEVLADAAKLTTDQPIELVQADARRLPWAAGSFDVVTCNLALHHFSPTDAVQVLRELWRVSGRGVVVVDLTRGYPAYAGAWLATRTLARNRVTRHDGPLSVLRAYTPAEMRSLAVRAGMAPFRQYRHAFFRQALRADKYRGAE